MAVPYTPTIACPILIGRLPHLDALVQLTEQARGGRGHVALISGEAGIGKSRLLIELGARLSSSQVGAASGAVQIMEGRCFEPDATVPYAPILDALHTFRSTRPAARWTATPGTAEGDLVSLLPELGGPAIAPPAHVASDQAREKRRLFQALTRLFTEVAATQVLLLLIEDLHWSDENSLEYVLSLARVVASRPILLLLTYRIDEVQPPLARFLADLERARLATEFSLTRLSGMEVGAMLRAIFPLARPLPAEVREAISALTEGNPFFIEEVLKALITTGDLSYSAGVWSYRPLDTLIIPRTIQVAIQRRVDRVSVEARDLLALFAVAGQRCDFALLQALTPHDERTLVRLFKELIAAQLVVEGAEEVFAFRHALTQHAIYTGLLARERTSFHRAVAAAMVHLYGAGDAHVGALAYHCYQGGDWAGTLVYARHAAEKALSLFAPRAALEHFTHALEAARHLRLPPPLDLHRARAHVYETLGEFERSRGDHERVLHAAGLAGDREAAWQSLLDLGALWTARDYQQAGAYFQQAIAQARDLDDPAILARTLNRVGNWYANLDRPLDGLRYHQEAREIFERLADGPGLAETLDFLGTSSLTAALVPVGMAYYRQAIPLLRAQEDHPRLISCLGMATMGGVNYLSSTTAGPATGGADSIGYAEEALTLARQIGWRAGEAFALAFLGLGLGPKGDFGRAYRCAHASLEIAAEIEHGLWQTFAHFLLGSLARDLLAWPVARRHLEAALDLARETGSLFWCRISAAALASTCVAQGDASSAMLHLQDDTRQMPDSPTMAQRILWCARAELDLALKNPERALAIVDALVAAIELEPGTVIPRLWHLRAQALIALDRTTEAASLLQASRITAAQHGTRAVLWPILVSGGRLAQTLGHRKQAASAFNEARAIAEDLARSVPDEHLRAGFLHAVAAQLPRRSQPTSRQLARQAAGGLTEREREVVAHIAQGASNRGIAAQLILSERTVEKHIERVMAKLGMNSRAQIAAWAVETGNAPRPVV